jgi:hypothetical protein
MKRDRGMVTELITKKCPCGKRFDVDPLLPRTGYPGYCDECNERFIEAQYNERLGELEGLVMENAPGASIFFPANPLDPEPWKTWAREIKRARWAGKGLLVVEVHRGDEDPTLGVEYVEDEDGARIWLGGPA